MIKSHLGLNNLDNLLVRDGQMLLGSTIDLRRLVDYVSVVWIGNRVRLLLQVEQSAAAEEGVIFCERKFNLIPFSHRPYLPLSKQCGIKSEETNLCNRLEGIFLQCGLVS